MPAKRGRKINESLPPNRARDSSRAFRARQAAYLQALRQRISELEAENDHFRQVHGYPPSSRPPLGRGPTGLQSPSLPTEPSSRDVPVMELGGRNDLQKLMLLSHWPGPMPTDIYFSSPNTSTQSPDGPIDDHCGGLDLLPNRETRESAKMPQHYVHTHPYCQHNADISSQNRPTLPFAEFMDLSTSMTFM